MSDDIRIVIADDHPIVRRGLVQVIQNYPALKVIAEADDGEDALARIEEMKPRIAVLDVNMPKLVSASRGRFKSGGCRSRSSF